MKNAVGLKHIAIELGVSLTTVSRALSDAPDIGEEMKAKVRKKALELKYTPNIFAKSLSTGKSNIIAIIVDSLVSPYFSLVVDMLSREIKSKGYSVTLFPIDHGYTEKEDIKAILATGVDGIISFTIPKKDAVELTALHSKPIALFGRGSSEPYLSVFYSDDVKGGYLAARYLHKKGHDKLLYLGSSVVEVSNYRFEGYKQYCQEHQLDCCMIDFNDVKESFESLYKEGYTGLFAFDDQLASIVKWRHKEKDIDVVGFNGLSQFDETAVSFQEFPSVCADYKRMVNDCVSHLIEEIKDDDINPIKKKYDVSIINGGNE